MTTTNKTDQGIVGYLLVLAIFVSFAVPAFVG